MRKLAAKSALLYSNTSTPTRYGTRLVLLTDQNAERHALSFHQDYPDQLVRLQTEHWEPVIEWAKKTFDIEIHMFTSILSNAQPEETKTKLLAELLKMNKWELAGKLQLSSSWTG